MAPNNQIEDYYLNSPEHGVPISLYPYFFKGFYLQAVSSRKRIITSLLISPPISPPPASFPFISKSFQIKNNF